MTSQRRHDLVHPALRLRAACKDSTCWAVLWPGACAPSPTSVRTLLGASTVSVLPVPRPTGTPRRAAVQSRQDFLRNDPGDISAFLCNILEANNVKPKRVLRAKNLPTNDMQDVFAIQALFEAAARFMPETVASDTDASGTDHSPIDSQASDASDDL